MDTSFDSSDNSTQAQLLGGKTWKLPFSVITSAFDESIHQSDLECTCAGVYGGLDYMPAFACQYARQQNVKVIVFYRGGEDNGKDAENEEKSRMLGVGCLEIREPIVWIFGIRVAEHFRGLGLGHLILRELIRAGIEEREKRREEQEGVEKQRMKILMATTPSNQAMTRILDSVPLERHGRPILIWPPATFMKRMEQMRDDEKGAEQGKGPGDENGDDSRRQQPRCPSIETIIRHSIPSLPHDPPPRRLSWQRCSSSSALLSCLHCLDPHLFALPFEYNLWPVHSKRVAWAINHGTLLIGRDAQGESVEAIIAVVNCPEMQDRPVMGIVARNLVTLACVIRDNFAVREIDSGADPTHLDGQPGCCVLQPTGTLLESLPSPSAPWRSDQSMRAFCNIVSLSGPEAESANELIESIEPDKRRFDVYLVYELN